MRNGAKKQIKKPYLTLLVITAVVYFFLRFIWPLFAPLIVAFLLLLLVEPGLSKWSTRFRIRKKPLAYVVFAMTIAGIVAGIWFGIVPYIKGCDFSWCEELLKVPFVQKIYRYLQENGIGAVASASSSALKIGSKVLFNIGAYGLSIFLLAAIFGKLKKHMEGYDEGILVLGIGGDIISYLKAFLKTQGKLFLIQSGLCMLVLSVTGIANGWLIGLLAGILDFFPILGVGIVLVPTAIWQFVAKDYVAGAVCAVLFVSCVIVREVLEPKFLGQAIKLPAIGIWTSVYAGIQLFGASGILKGPIAYLLISTIYRRIQYKGEDTI